MFGCGELLPQGLTGLDDEEFGLPLQLTLIVEQYIKKLPEKGAFHAPQASQKQMQLNTLPEPSGRMETIRLILSQLLICEHKASHISSGYCMLGPTKKDPLPFSDAYFPFALVNDMSWWAVPLVLLVVFT